MAWSSRSGVGFGWSAARGGLSQRHADEASAIDSDSRPDHKRLGACIVEAFSAAGPRLSARPRAPAQTLPSIALGRVTAVRHTPAVPPSQQQAAPPGALPMIIAREYEEPIHVLLTDVVLPWMNGRQIAEEIVVGP